MNDSALRVSVVMPVYNGARFVDAAIRSVLAQSLEAFELIVVDDGSTDRTSDIIGFYAARDDRIRTVTQANTGISAALNAGIAAAGAPWIARLDADDVMLPTRLDRQLAFLADNSDVVAAGSYYDLIDVEGARRGGHRPLPRTREELSLLLARRERLTFTHPTMIYRRAAVIAAGGYRKALEPCEDVDLFARLLATGAAILIQPEVLTLYRVHPGSISRSATREQVLKCRYVFHNFYAARDGSSAVSYEAFLAMQARLPLADRIAGKRELVSEHLYRAYTAAMVDGRKARATIMLVAASSLRPTKALRRGLRSLRLSRPSSAGA